MNVVTSSGRCWIFWESGAHYRISLAIVTLTSSWGEDAMAHFVANIQPSLSEISHHDTPQHHGTPHRPPHQQPPKHHHHHHHTNNLGAAERRTSDPLYSDERRPSTENRGSILAVCTPFIETPFTPEPHGSDVNLGQ
uniref:Uncharacterized protein n=1 Tax=Rhodnius prolixus TaxID=13249 RepID=T1I5Z8_RHOPR